MEQIETRIVPDKNKKKWDMLTHKQKRNLMTSNNDGGRGGRVFIYISLADELKLATYSRDKRIPLEMSLHYCEEDFPSTKAFLEFLDQCINDIDNGLGYPATIETVVVKTVSATDLFSKKFLHFR